MKIVSTFPLPTLYFYGHTFSAGCPAVCFLHAVPWGSHLLSCVSMKLGLWVFLYGAAQISVVWIYRSAILYSQLKNANISENGIFRIIVFDGKPISKLSQGCFLWFFLISLELIFVCYMEEKKIDVFDFRILLQICWVTSNMAGVILLF